MQDESFASRIAHKGQSQMYTITNLAWRDSGQAHSQLEETQESGERSGSESGQCDGGNGEDEMRLLPRTPSGIACQPSMLAMARHALKWACP